MEATVLSIHWHDHNRAIYSVDFQQTHEKIGNDSTLEKNNKVLRLATGGGDNNIRIWELILEEKKPIVKYLSTLSKHTQAVNVVRFNPANSNLLGTAGDDGIILIWEKSEKLMKDFNNSDLQDLESWNVKYSYRFSTSSEIYDLCWSKDGKHVIIGSMDNLVRIFTSDLKVVKVLNNHSHYVQGVAWDPFNEYIASQSVDRSVNIYKIIKKDDNTLDFNIWNKVYKTDLPKLLTKRNLSQGFEVDKPVKKSKTRDGSESDNQSATVNDSSKEDDSNNNTENDEKHTKDDKAYRTAMIYHNETLLSFFRRLSFSPDGSILLTPTGIFKIINENKKEQIINTVYCYIRSQFDKGPVFQLPNLKKPAIAIKFSPIFYTLRWNNTQEEETTTLRFIKNSKKKIIKVDEFDEDLNNKEKHLKSTRLLQLPYRMIFAVATQDSMVLYDTSTIHPLAVVKNLHYSNFTDLSWAEDGRSLIITSTDGFCSLIQLDDKFLGGVYEGSVGISSADTSNADKWTENKTAEKISAKDKITITDKSVKPNVIDIQSLVRKKKST